MTHTISFSVEHHEELQTPNGVAFSGFLLADGKVVAFYHHQGDGGCILWHPHGDREAMDAALEALGNDPRVDELCKALGINPKGLTERADWGLEVLLQDGEGL